MNSTLFRKRPLRDLLAQTVLFAAGATALTALAMWAAPLFAWFDVLRQGWLVIAALAGALLMAAGLLRAWTALGAAALALASMLLLVSLHAPVSARPGLEDEAPSLVFVTHNLWGRWVTAEDALDVLAELDADVLAVQEANGGAREIQAALDSRYPHKAACDLRGSRLYSRAIIRASGCILWREELLRLPDGSLTDFNPPATAWAEIETPDGGTAFVFAVHMTWPEPFDAQEIQRRSLQDFIDRLGDRVDPARLVILGDLNAAAPSLALRRSEAVWGIPRRTGGLATWPAPLPFMGIDHVLAGDAWTTVSVDRGRATGSDHYPVRVVLALEGSASFPD